MFTIFWSSVLEPVTSSTNNAPNTSSPKKYHKGTAVLGYWWREGYTLKVSPRVSKTDSLTGPDYRDPDPTSTNQPMITSLEIWTYTSNFTFFIRLNAWLPQAPDSAVCSANWKIFCLGFFNEVRVVQRCNMCSTRDRFQAFLAVWCTLRETNIPHHWKRKIIGS